jgi:NTE family protein
VDTWGRSWADALPRPVAFVLSGGASLGAIQVGMLQALAEAGLEPDLVVGTSVGSLNGAVVAEQPSLDRAVTVLERTWKGLRRRQVFPGGSASQALSVLRTGNLHVQDGLVRLVRRTLRVDTFEALARPLTIVTGDVLTGHVRWFREGELLTPLLAATAIPGVFPPVRIDGGWYADAGSVANVPLQAAVAQGAGSLVVLDAGDVCHLDVPPRGIPDALVAAMVTAMRQRVLIEAPQVAERLPVLYLPRPCARNRSLLDLDTSAELIAPTYEVVAEFLRHTDVPVAGRLSGAPHYHHADEGQAAVGLADAVS